MRSQYSVCAVYSGKKRAICHGEERARKVDGVKARGVRIPQGARVYREVEEKKG